MTNRTLPIALLVLVGVAACGQPAPPPSPVMGVDTVFVVDTVRVTTESGIDPDLEDQIARLQIQILERDVQVSDLQEQLVGTRQELVRNMAKLQSQATRAEAASGLAEAEIAVRALGRSVGGSELPEFSMAEGLIAQSTDEFNDENYVGALYLATEARALARSGQSRVGSGTGSAVHEGEELFALPVPLLTVSRSNVRDGPGLGYSVLFTLEGGASVTGQSHTAQWVRVVDGEGKDGWIFHTLVSGR